MYKKILVTMDCSSIDNAIIKHVIELSKLTNSKVYLLHVLHVHTRDEMNYISSVTDNHLNNMLLLLKENNIEAESVMEYGDPEKVIPQVIKDLNIDLLALATHGHNKFMNFIYGSVVDKIRHIITVPILLINAKKL